MITRSRRCGGCRKRFNGTTVYCCQRCESLARERRKKYATPIIDPERDRRIEMLTAYYANWIGA